MRNKWLLTGLLIGIIFTSCDDKKPDVQWNFAKDEIIGKNNTSSEKLSVDLYLDVTTSMKGFSSSSNTPYSVLIDDIESICQKVWKNSDVRWYKYGAEVVEITSDEFKSGKTSKDIYSGPISRQTNFDKAIQKTNPKRVSILVTDFFYNQNDVNRVLDAFKLHAIQKNLEIGIMGLKSDFDGIVADVQPPVPVSGARPFYVIIVGDKQNIKLFFKSLQNQAHVSNTQYYIITNKPTQEYSINVIKDKKCKTINKQSLNKQYQDYGTIFNFRMKESQKEAKLNFDIVLTEEPNSFNYNENNLKFLVFKKTSGNKDSLFSENDLSFANVKFLSGKITGDINIRNNDGVGKYSYLVYTTFDNTVKPIMPKWITENDAETFSKGVNETKTLNLKKLLTDITTYNITYNQPKLAKFYINIEKK
jgi:hypothetical protein